MGMPVSEVCLQRMSGPSVDLGSRHAPCECASASSLNIGRIRALVMRGIPWRGITLSGASSQLDTKSPQPRWVCGLAWNSGVAGIRSVAVGLARTLRVGEFVELVDVGLGNHDVDGGEHEWAPRGIVSVIVSLLDEAGDRPAVLVRGACQRG